MGRLDEKSMADLMRLGLTGNRAAYEDFFRQLAPSLEGMVAAIAPSLSPHDRQDVAQEVMLAIHRKRHTWQQTRPILPWVYAITRYRLIDRLRQLQRQRARVDDGFDMENMTGGTPADKLIFRYELERALKALSGKTATVLFAMGIEGKDVKQTSRDHGMTENAVRLHFHRGLKKLRLLFGNAE